MVRLNMFPLAILPTIITQAISPQKYIYLGNLEPTRDFTFVFDTCEALVKLVKCDNSVGKIINICSGKEISIRDLAKL